MIIAASGLQKVLDDFTGFTSVPTLEKWQRVIDAQSKKHDQIIRIGMVAKYLDNEDTYISVIEALKAAAWQEDVGLDLVWINAEKATEEDFKSVDGIVVPGGFGSRGIEGKVSAANYALSTGSPYLGLCLGLQVAVIAAARRSGLTAANSTEFVPDTQQNVVYLMDGQAGKESTGGTMRLGDYPAKLVEGSKVARAYGDTSIVERHRHRYEVNQAFRADIERGGLVISGTSPDGQLVEFVETQGA